MNVVILHDCIDDDSRADERDALVQAEAVETALHALGHSSSRLPFALNLAAVADALRGLRPDVVFNLVEAVEGHARLIHLAPALLDSLALPYTGADADGMYLTSNKVLAKRILHGAGVATPRWLVAEGKPATAVAGYGPFIPGRYIIKSVWEEASVGLNDASIIEARSADEISSAIARRAPALGGSGFAEAFIDGREFNLALLAGPGGPTVLPAAEIRFDDYAPGKPRIVGYAAKWEEKSFEFSHTPRTFDFPASDRPLIEQLQSIALHCWRLFDLRGYVRVDFRIDGDGRPWVLEINANPCLSPDAGFAAALTRAEISVAEAIACILADCGARASP